MKQALCAGKYIGFYLSILTSLFCFEAQANENKLENYYEVAKGVEFDTLLLASSQLSADTEELLEQSYESYRNGNPQQSENMLRQIFEVLSEDSLPSFELPDPGGVRQSGFNFLGLISYQSTRTVASEVTILDGITDRRFSTGWLPLKQLFDYAVYRISSSPRSYEISDFQTQVHRRFGGCLRFGIPGSEFCTNVGSQQAFPGIYLNGSSADVLTQGELDYASRLNSGRNIHATLIDSLDLIQRSLISQGTQDKYEEALLFAEVGRNISFSRIAPAVLYGSQNYEILSRNSSYTDLFSKIPSYDLNIATVKEAASKQNATIVYYSTAASDSENKLFIWVIQPSGEIEFRNVDLSNLGRSLRQLVRETSIASSSFIDRGQQGRAVVVAVRAPELSQQLDLAEQFLEDESVQNLKLRSLYNVLVDPVSDLLPTDPESNVIFVPHRELMSVPFAALKDSQDKYLIEKHTISIAHSARSLRNRIEPIEESPTGAGFFGIGNPSSPSNITYTADNSPVVFPNLSAADSEVVEISSSDGAWVRRDDATQRYVIDRLEGPKVIHFATHGLLNYANRKEFILLQLIEDGKNQSFYVPQDPRNIQWNSDSDLEYRLWYDQSDPDRSWQAVYAKVDVPGAIVLADGALTTERILSLDLNADLVVLSACNTGRGVPTESGILGLPLAFGLAGVPRIVVSQWAVPDQSTRVLMIAFYDAMEEDLQNVGRTDPASALRKAMLKTKDIQGFSDPIFWAGFTMMNVSY